MRMFRFPRRRGLPRLHCGVCDGDGFLSADYVFAREPVCTCGAGPYDEWTLHSPDCDTVPCPFCQLLDDSAAGSRRSREQAKA